MAQRRSNHISTFGSQLTAIVSVTLVLLILGILAVVGIAGNSGADNEEIEFSYHNFVYFSPQSYKISYFVVLFVVTNS